MTGGFVTGGWEFVWSAYGITFGALTAYGVSIYLRFRTERSRHATRAVETARSTTEAP